MNKYAVVTGSSRGVGAALARALAANGYSVAVCYNTSKNLAFKVATESSSFGTLVIPVHMNVASETGVKKAFEYINACFPRIDLLINNAATDAIRPLEDTSFSQWKKITETNLNGVFLTSREVLPKMRETGGTIINVSSIWAQKGASCEAPYSASKAGVEGFTRSVAKEYPSVRTLAVSLGFVDTDMTAGLTEAEINAFLQANKEVSRRTPDEAANEILKTINDESVCSGEVVRLW